MPAFSPCRPPWHTHRLPAVPKPQPPSLSGQVQDSTGAIIPNASIDLRRLDGTLAASTTSDSAGQFRLAQPAPGDYRLSIALPGFEPLVRPVRIGRTPLGPLTLSLNLASVSTSVVVNAGESLDVAAPDQNQDTPTLSADDMKSLPILDGDVIATLSAFLDAGVSGEGGTTLMVDGVEMKSVGVAPSAIERVSINQDPYSAQYRQPGRGQVEVITKSTAGKFHGAITFTFRNSALSATNYFATSKPPDQRQTYEGYLTGPIKPLRNTTFLFSLNRQQEDAYAQVNASTGPGEVVNQNILQPFRNTNLTIKAAHQINDHHSATSSTASSTPTAAIKTSAASPSPPPATTPAISTWTSPSMTISPRAQQAEPVLHLFERNHDSTISAQQTPAIIVQGVFNAAARRTTPSRPKTIPTQRHR